MTKLLSLLVYPLSQCLLLALFALVARFRGHDKLAFGGVFVGVLWLYICSTSHMAGVLMAGLERSYTPTAISAIEPVDALVVLGGATRGDTHMSSLGDLNQQADRLVHAAALYKAGKAPIVVVTGGSAPGYRPEAQLMQEILEVMGIPGQAIVQESRSRDTHDNARYTSEMLLAMGVRKVLLVTSAFHMRRSMAVFAGRGLDIVPAPTDFQRLVSTAPTPLPGWLPTVESLQRSTYALREYVGYGFYWLRGWIK
jgi:uncharacterized SAM-binding protein YcdF (DUF218 family)